MENRKRKVGGQEEGEEMPVGKELSQLNTLKHLDAGEVQTAFETGRGHLL